MSNPIESYVTSLKDTLICMGNNIKVPGDSTHHHFLWNDGDTSRIRILDKAGTYWQQSLKSCTAFIDTFIISYGSEGDTIFHQGLDTTICFAPQASISASLVADYYSWSDGTTGRTCDFTSSGTKVVYGIREESPCTVWIDSVTVTFVRFNPDLPDRTLCKGQQIILDAATINATGYLWSDGSAQSKLPVNSEGLYWVAVSAGVCTKTDTIWVSATILNPDLGPDRNICEGDLVRLETGIPEAAYLWQNGSTANSITVKDSGLYYVTVFKGDCTESDTIHISFINCYNCVSVPNAFTPNKDGRNEGFRPILHCPAVSYKFTIMNRYGQEVFSSQDAGKEWDGTFNGYKMEVGVYYYLLLVTFDYNGAKEELHKGDVSLLR